MDLQEWEGDFFKKHNRIPTKKELAKFILFSEKPKTKQHALGVRLDDNVYLAVNKYVSKTNKYKNVSDFVRMAIEEKLRRK